MLLTQQAGRSGDTLRDANKKGQPMSASVRSRFTARMSDPTIRPQHKFAIGQTVALRWPAGRVRPKDPKQALASTMFEIVRLMPEQNDLMHYRIKNSATGQERMVAETDLQSDAE